MSNAGGTAADGLANLDCFFAAGRGAAWWYISVLQRSFKALATPHLCVLGTSPAAALRCIGGQMQGCLLFSDDDEKQREANTARNILAIIKWRNAMSSMIVIVGALLHKCKTLPTALTFLKQLLCLALLSAARPRRC